MPRIVIAKEVEAPVGTVWALLADFADVSWIPVAGRVDVDGSGVGMRRAIHGAGDRPVVETLTHFDGDRMELGYSITDNPLPVSRFEALVSVHPSPGGAAEITWTVDYDPAGPEEADAAQQAIEAVYGMMAGWLADAATQART